MVVMTGGAHHPSVLPRPCTQGHSSPEHSATTEAEQPGAGQWAVTCTVGMRVCLLTLFRGASGAPLCRFPPPRAQAFVMSNRADQRDGHGHGRQRRQPQPAGQSSVVLENALRDADGCGRGDDVCVGIFG